MCYARDVICADIANAIISLTRTLIILRLLMFSVTCYARVGEKSERGTKSIVLESGGWLLTWSELSSSYERFFTLQEGHFCSYHLG